MRANLGKVRIVINGAPPASPVSNLPRFSVWCFLSSPRGVYWVRRTVGFNVTFGIYQCTLDLIPNRSIVLDGDGG